MKDLNIFKRNNGSKNKEIKFYTNVDTRENNYFLSKTRGPCFEL